MRHGNRTSTFFRTCLLCLLCLFLSHCNSHSAQEQKRQLKAEPHRAGVHQPANNQPSTWETPPQSTDTRLLLGIDGGDWHFLIPLMKQGKLPSIEKLFRRGAHGFLQSQTMASPLEWTIIATSVPPRHNGITGFVVHDEKKGKKTVVSGTLRKVKAFWNILTDHDISTALVGWWVTWPADHIKGALVADLFPYRDTLQHTCYPPSLKNELERISQSQAASFQEVLEHQLGFTDFRTAKGHGRKRSRGKVQDRFGLFLRDFRYDLEKTAYFTHLLQKSRYGQVVLFLNSTDISSHLFYRLTAQKAENGGWPENRKMLRRYGRIIEFAYRKSEEGLRFALENLSSLKQVLIVSDHGFTHVTYRKKPRWNLLFHDLGLLQFRKEAARKAFRTIDWKRSIAAVDPRVQGSTLRIIIANGKRQKDNTPVINEVTRVLSQLTTRKGTPIFRTVENSAAGSSFKVKILVSQKELERGLLLKGHAYDAGRFIREPHLSGGHRKSGIILWWGAGVVEGAVMSGTTTYDITPTLLWSHTIAPSREMRGKVHQECLTKAAKKRQLPPIVESYGPHLRENPQLQRVDESVDDTIKNKLRALGYID